MDKFKNKYRIESNRWAKWDYSDQAAYFITICTKNREHYFGECQNGIMNLSEIGIIAQSEWEKSFELRPDMNLIRDEFIVMPNHFHAIIHIGKNKYNTPNFLEDSNNRSTGAMHCASSASSPSSASNASSASSASTNPKKSKSSTKNQFGPQSKNLASIIRGFKIGVTVNARKITPGFAWQPNYHDHVIRDNNEYQRIKIYIINNPANWKEDKFQKS